MGIDPEFDDIVKIWTITSRSAFRVGRIGPDGL